MVKRGKIKQRCDLLNSSMNFDKCMITCFVLISFVISLQCDVKRKGKVKIAECKNIGLTGVPQFLPTDINVLDLSGNNIEISSITFLFCCIAIVLKYFCR